MSVAVSEKPLRYDAVMEALGGLDESLFESLRDAQTVSVFVDLPDHLNELGAVHIDSIRALLDWISSRQARGRIRLCSCAERGTGLAFREYGYVHLEKEYPNIELIDLNRSDFPDAHFSILVSVPHHSDRRGLRETKVVWDSMQSSRGRHYSPTGFVWKPVEASSDKTPDLVLVDARHARFTNMYNRPEKQHVGAAIAGAELEAVHGKICDILTHTK